MKKNVRHAIQPRIKKRHWFLGSVLIVIGSWVTHTTTARISEDFSYRQALEFARSVPTNGTPLTGGLPDPLFIPELQNGAGPMSDSNLVAQSPSNHLFVSAATQSPQFDETAYSVKRGDTLGAIFKRLGLGHALPHSIGQHEAAKQLVKIRSGSNLYFGFDTANNLRQIRYPVGTLEELLVMVEDEKIVDVKTKTLPFQTVEKAVSGEIKTSLYEAALDAGLSIEVVMDMVRIFGWDIDFVLDIRSGDTFHVIYEQFQLNGERLSDGGILAAEFTTQNQTFRAIQYTDANGETSHYTPEGESMLGTFLRSPVEFSRISSRFGNRKHPILKTWRAHKGVDYAASRGTPIRATADGKIIHAGNKGGYGKAVILKHADRFTTLYAHMNGFAKDIRSGNRVKQGQVIGYVGSTGLASGPHLHYEFRLDGVHRNPLTFKTPKASAVPAEEIDAFRALVDVKLAKLDGISREYQLAKASGASSSSAIAP
jgi:murein DD-endopeptidase MepM/ murein hydrolase activator NlpD